MIIGITGGIGVGKSTLVSFFKEQGAEIIDVDKLGWKALEKKRTELIKAFGDKILIRQRRSEIDRKKLGKLVFSYPDKKKLFDSIIQASLVKELKKRMVLHRANKMLVIDCALIYEWGIESWFDKIILVTSSYEKRLKRLLNSGYTQKEIKFIVKSQLPDGLKSPNFIIENNDDIESFKKKFKDILEKLDIQ
ncbi:dephospho-CoA kinase [candidate division WOR-3 bacterium]|nr:dephospho-CoA kinase [candidate division WOR-3 bacterium]